MEILFKTNRERDGVELELWVNLTPQLARQLIEIDLMEDQIRSIDTIPFLGGEYEMDFECQLLRLEGIADDDPSYRERGWMEVHSLPKGYGGDFEEDCSMLPVSTRGHGVYFEMADAHENPVSAECLPWEVVYRVAKENPQ